MLKSIAILSSLIACTASAQSYAARPTIGLGVYGGSAQQVVVGKPKRSSLVTGNAEMTFGSQISRTNSWHISLQSLAMQGSLLAEKPENYEGFRVGGRYIHHYGRFNALLGLGVGAMTMQESPRRQRSIAFFSPELGIGLTFYKSERASWDLTMMNSLYLSEGLYDIPRNMFAPQVGLSVTMALGKVESPRFIYVGDGAIRGLGYLLHAGGKSGLFAARGVFTVLRGIR